MKSVLTRITALLLAPLLALKAADAPRTAARPNILFILADDLSYGDLSCFGQKRFKTPNIDKLAAGGLVCKNAYAGGSWCAPSRTSLLTGLRADRWSSRPRKAHPTVAEVLKQAGYRTGVFGKWHVVDDDKLLPGKRGFDTALVGYMAAHPELNSANLNKMNPYFPEVMLREDGREIRFPENQRVTDEYVWSYGPSSQREAPRTRMYDAEGRFKDPSGNTEVTYSEDIYRQAAVNFLRSAKDGPFFLYYATPLPHSPIGVKSLGRFKEVPKDWALKPEASTTFPRQLWAAMIEELDRSVGLLLDELKSLGVEKNTVVVFAADNGYACWGNWDTGGRWNDDPFFQHKGPWDRGKFINTSGGLAVPFIMAWPGTLPPGTTERAVGFYDFMATCAELANAPLPGPTDGVSLLPLLRGRSEQFAMRSEMVFPKEAGGNLSQAYPMNSVLLDEQWFATAEVGSPGSKTHPVRLFDITSDPGCQRDLSMEKNDLAARAVKVLTVK